MLSIGIITLVITPGCDFQQQCKHFIVNQAIALFVWSLFFYISICDGLFWGNIYELYAAMFLSVFITAWSVWRKLEPGIDNYLEYMFLISNSVTQFFYLIVSYYLYKEYRWVVWKKAGPDEAIQGMYQNYLKWSCFQKLDMSFSGFCILLSGLGVYNTGWESALDVTMSVLLVITVISGYIFVKNEYSLATKLWILLLPSMPAYVIAWFIMQKSFDQSGKYSLYGPFLICGSFLLLTRTILVYFTVIVIRNYGKGLKDLTTTTDQTEVVIIEEDSDEDYFETQDSNASIQY
jgi:hypothetical protein